jgi:TIP49-like protein
MYDEFCKPVATEFDLEAEEYVPLPKGDVHKKKEIVQVCRHCALCTVLPGGPGCLSSYTARYASPTQWCAYGTALCSSKQYTV